MMAANKIKINSISAIFLGLGQFIALFFILKFGGSPMWIQYMSLLLVIGFSLFVKPYVLWKEIDYSIKELGACYLSCLKVLVLALVLSLPFRLILDDSIPHALLQIIISIIAVFTSSLVFMRKESRTKLIVFVINKIRN